MQKQTKKEDRRARRTKKLLAQTLAELMQEKQLSEITVKELADRADMNRGTFYLYYKDISNMLESIEDDILNSLNAIFERRELEGTAKQRAGILKDLLSAIKENKQMVGTLLSPKGDINFLHRLNDLLHEKYLQHFKKTDLSISKERLDYQYSFLVFGTGGLIRAWVSRGCKEPADQMAQLLESFIRKGS
jgi:AcrR family transcriptional regulator